jgi:membrane protein required for colicin V production
MLIDIILVVCIALGFILGFRGGIIRSLLSFVGLFLGVAVAVKCTALVSQYLYKNFAVEAAWWPFVVFIALLVIVVLVMKLIAILMEKVLDGASLGLLNKLSGAAVWCCLMVLLLSLGLWFANQGGLIRPELKAESHTYSYLLPIGPWTLEVMGNIIPWFKGMFEVVTNELDELVKKAS